MTLVLPSAKPVRPRRFWSGQEFDRLSADGWFDGQRVELVNGEILEMPPMNDPHAQAVQLANYVLLPIFPPTWATIRVQCPMRLGESRPFPDLAAVKGTPREVVRHPETALLVIEVSDTTLEFDRWDKCKLYAMHGLPEYWIINLKGRCLEIYRNPLLADPSDPRYGSIRVALPEDDVSPLAAPEAVIRIADLLP